MIPARAGLPIAVVLPLVAAQDAPPTARRSWTATSPSPAGREAHERVQTEASEFGRRVSVEMRRRDHRPISVSICCKTALIAGGGQDAKEAEHRTVSFGVR